MLSREDWRTATTEEAEHDRDSREARLERTEDEAGAGLGERSCENTEISRTDLDLESRVSTDCRGRGQFPGAI